MINILRIMARAMIKRRQPIIVGIAGLDVSLTKEAIFLILSKNYFVRKTEGDNANETDLLLTIIGTPNIRVSFANGIIIFSRFFATILLPLRYPDVLLLEMNIENSQNMERLMNLIPIKVGVITRISSEHKEQRKLITFLSEDSFAIFNAEDQLAVKMGEKTKTKAKIITYGFGEGASLLADNLVFHKGEERGFSFKLNYDGNTIPVRLPKIAAANHIEPVLAAVAAGIALKMNLVEIVSVLES